MSGCWRFDEFGDLIYVVIFVVIQEGGWGNLKVFDIYIYIYIYIYIFVCV